MAKQYETAVFSTAGILSGTQLLTQFGYDDEYPLISNVNIWQCYRSDVHRPPNRLHSQIPPTRKVHMHACVQTQRQAHADPSGELDW